MHLGDTYKVDTYDARDKDALLKEKDMETFLIIPPEETEVRGNGPFFINKSASLWDSCVGKIRAIFMGHVFPVIIRHACLNKLQVAQRAWVIPESTKTPS